MTKRRYRGRPINITIEQPRKTIVMEPTPADLFGTMLIIERQAENPRSPQEVWEELFNAPKEAAE